MILETIIVATALSSVAGGTTILGYHLGKKNRPNLVKAKKVPLGSIVNCASLDITNAKVICRRAKTGNTFLGLKKSHINARSISLFEKMKDDKYIDGVKSIGEVSSTYPYYVYVLNNYLLEIVPSTPSKFEKLEAKTDDLLKEAEQEVEDFLNPPPPKETVAWSFNYILGVSKCTKCKGYNRWKGKGYTICSCKDYARPHFHIICPHCDHKVIMRSADDV